MDNYVPVSSIYKRLLKAIPYDTPSHLFLLRLIEYEQKSHNGGHDYIYNCCNANCINQVDFNKNKTVYKLYDGVYCSDACINLTRLYMDRYWKE